MARGLFLADRVLAAALLSIGWRSFFQIQDQRQNSAYHKHDRDQQHRGLPGSQLLNVSGQRPPQHNLSAQVRLWSVERGFVEIKLARGPRGSTLRASMTARPARSGLSAARTFLRAKSRALFMKPLVTG